MAMVEEKGELTPAGVGQVMYGAEKSAGVNIRSSCASLPHRPQGTNLDCLCPTDTRLITEEKYDI